MALQSYWNWFGNCSRSIWTFWMASDCFECIVLGCLGRTHTQLNSRIFSKLFDCSQCHSNALDCPGQFWRVLESVGLLWTVQDCLGMHLQAFESFPWLWKPPARAALESSQELARKSLDVRNHALTNAANHILLNRCYASLKAWLFSKIAKSRPNHWWEHVFQHSARLGWLLRSQLETQKTCSHHLWGDDFWEFSMAARAKTEIYDFQ